VNYVKHENTRIVEIVDTWVIYAEQGCLDVVFKARDFLTGRHLAFSTEHGLILYDDSHMSSTPWKVLVALKTHSDCAPLHRKPEPPIPEKGIVK
jgi:hypothetical protein